MHQTEAPKKIEECNQEEDSSSFIEQHISESEGQPITSAEDNLLAEINEVMEKQEIESLISDKPI